MKRFLLLLMLPFSAWQVATAGLPALSLKDLLNRAREANPEIIQARQTWRMAKTQISSVGAWPDPTFTYVDEDFASGMMGVAPETIHHYRIEQMIPFPGKLTNESRMKHHEALIAGENYRAKLIDILSQVRMRYYQLYLTDEKITLAAGSVEIMKNALKTTQARLGSNQSSALDVFMAQTELRKMENTLFEQQQQRLLIAEELNTLLNKPPDTPLGAAQPPPLAELPAPLEKLQTVARENDPLYLSAMHEINHSKAMMSRSRLGFLPDFGVMYEKEVTPVGPSGQQIGVSMTFPLWFRRPWANYQEAREHILEAAAGSASMENMVRKMVHHEFTETQTSLTLARNDLNAILPAALSSLKIARAQYASGQVDFLHLLEAFRTWIATHNEYQEHLYDYGEHWTELERWVGVDLTQAKAALQNLKSVPEEKHGH